MWKGLLWLYFLPFCQTHSNALLNCNPKSNVDQECEDPGPSLEPSSFVSLGVSFQFLICDHNIDSRDMYEDQANKCALSMSTWAWVLMSPGVWASSSPEKQSGKVDSEHRAGGEEEVASHWDHGVLDKSLLC